VWAPRGHHCLQVTTAAGTPCPAVSLALGNMHGSPQQHAPIQACLLCLQKDRVVILVLQCWLGSSRLLLLGQLGEPEWQNAGAMGNFRDVLCDTETSQIWFFQDHSFACQLQHRTFA
jgi:hypothetical protein